MFLPQDQVTDNQTTVPNQGEKVAPVRDLLEWKSPSRPPFIFGKEEFTTAVSVCLLLSIILSFFREIFLIGFIWASLFFTIALSKRPPEETEHKITTQGLISMNHVYLWRELGPFWFNTRGKYPLIHIVQPGNILGSLVIVLPSEGPTKEDIRDVLAQYLPYIEVPEKSGLDKITDWLTTKLSLNKEK